MEYDDIKVEANWIMKFPSPTIPSNIGQGNRIK